MVVFCLFVAVNNGENYANLGLNPLRCPETDCRTIKLTLEVFLKKHSNTFFFKTLTGADATEENIKNCFNIISDCSFKGDDKKNRQIQDNDVFLFFYIGHGFVYSDNLFFANHDIELKDDQIHNGFSGEDFIEIIKNIKNKSVYFLDCCNAGKIIKTLVTDIPTNNEKRYIIASSPADATAYEKENSTILTSHLVETIKYLSQQKEKNEIKAWDIGCKIVELYKKDNERPMEPPQHGSGNFKIFELNSQKNKTKLFIAIITAALLIVTGIVLYKNAWLKPEVEQNKDTTSGGVNLVDSTLVPDTSNLEDTNDVNKKIKIIKIDTVPKSDTIIVYGTKPITYSNLKLEEGYNYRIIASGTVCWRGNDINYCSGPKGSAKSKGLKYTTKPPEKTVTLDDIVNNSKKYVDSLIIDGDVNKGNNLFFFIEDSQDNKVDTTAYGDNNGEYKIIIKKEKKSINK